MGPNGPVGGPDPEHGTYRSLATFSDPDGNSWLLQEITTRLPGRIDSGVTSFGSVSDLASAMRRAEAAPALEVNIPNYASAIVTTSEIVDSIASL